MPENNLDAMDPENDVSWFAYDSIGHIGYFVTLGTAPVHAVGAREVLKNNDLLYAFFELCSPLSEGSPTSTYLRSTRSKDPMDELFQGGWTDMARRGLYGYGAKQWMTYPSDYRHMIRPQVPLAMSSLPSDIQTVMKPLRLNVTFGAKEFITVADLLNVEGP